MFILKKIFLQTPHAMGVDNFNGDVKYKKMTNFNLKQFYLKKHF